MEELFQKLMDSVAAQIADIKAAYATELAAEKSKSFGEGVASVALPGNDKIYSQTELDAKVQEAVSQLQSQIDALKGEIEQLKVDAESGKEAAVAAFKADLLAKYKEQQVAETAAETGFADLLA